MKYQEPKILQPTDAVAGRVPLSKLPTIQRDFHDPRKWTWYIVYVRDGVDEEDFTQGIPYRENCAAANVIGSVDARQRVIVYKRTTLWDALRPQLGYNPLEAVRQ